MSGPAYPLYYIEDDTTSAQGGGGSGAQISGDFTAQSAWQAAALAQVFATLFQRAVRLVPKASAPPYTQYVPTYPGSYTVPTGIAF